MTRGEATVVAQPGSVSTRGGGPLIPVVPAPGRLKLPPVAERTLPNGLRVLALRRPGVPRFEGRLRVPLARPRDAGDPALHRLFAEALLAGTASASSLEIAQRLQHLGASLDAAADVEELIVAGSGLSGSLPLWLELLADVLSAPAFTAPEVAVAQDRMHQELRILRNQPGAIAHAALARRHFGDHAYARVLATQDEITALTPARLRRYHRQRVHAGSAVLVLVGDFRPAAVLDAVEATLERWPAGGPQQLLRPPAPTHGGPILLVDRPGSVQTSVRLAGPAVPRGHEDYPALVMANGVFGGSFSSRLTQNLREDKGFTYSPNSGISHNEVASWITVSADVATDVTAAALVEMRAELGRMAATLPATDELLSVRRYLQGSLQLSVATQAGLASQILRLEGSGVGREHLTRLPQHLEQVRPEAVRSVATRFLAPRRLVTVLVGDAERVAADLEPLEDVVVVAQPDH